MIKGIKEKKTKLVSDDVSLREITYDDTDFVVSLRNNPEIQNWFSSGAIVTIDGHEGFLKKYFSDENIDEIYIIENSDCRVGMISLYNISDNSAEWGRIAVHPTFQGKGLGKTALRLIIARSREIGISNLYCYVKRENAKAISMYELIGFVKKKKENEEYYMEINLQDNKLT